MSRKNNGLRIAIVAGEASGDILGAGLIRELRALFKNPHFEGIAGPCMLAEGCRTLYPMERLSVMGFVEAAGRFLELIPLRRRLLRRWTERKPDVYIGIDAPDFNLTLERQLRANGVRTVHYVSPSVWAWRGYRIKKIARSVDLMLTLFPFEEAFYQRYQIPVTFVGHPLADSIPERVEPGEARRQLGLCAQGRIVALLPGSRMSEVKYLAKPLVETAKWLSERDGSLTFILPVVNRKVEVVVRQAIEAVFGNQSLISICSEQSHRAIGACDVAIIASGTATLEALLLKRPMVITYKAHFITYQIMAYLMGRHLRHIGLPNILVGREIVPELLQDKARPEYLGPATMALLNARGGKATLLCEFHRIHQSLRQGGARRAAEAIGDLLRVRSH